MAWALDHLPSVLLRPFVMSFVTTALAPSPALFAAGAVLVNRDGRRFTDEAAAPAFALAEQPGKVGYIILDRRIADAFRAWPNFISTAPGVAYAYLDDYRRNRRDIYTTAATLDQLAGKLGMDVTSLVATARAWACGTDEGKPLGEGPFVALGPVRTVFVHAEGSTGQGGLLLRGHGHHLAWAFASGRRAGRNAAACV
jgi:fumarate reductase flavoprotein subunit